MIRVRPAAVAGRFYPSDPDALRAQVRSLLDDAPRGPQPKAMIVPHAGYIYSGPIAATAYRRIAGSSYRRIVLLGPSHRVPFRGLALSSASTFQTPLGAVAIAHDLDSRISHLPYVGVLDEAHAAEHSLEVQLPFLQELFGADLSLVPIAVGDATPDEVADVIDILWQDDETLVLISSDLSHYLDYATARERDEATTANIEALRPEAIRRDDACGRVPITGMLVVAKRRGLRVTTIDLRSSGDTAGPRDQVVGYGAYVFE